MSIHEKYDESINHKIAHLKKLNDQYTKNKNFVTYFENLLSLFNVSSTVITTNHKYFLGGFVEGEGSLNVSAKKMAEKALMIDPEFSITQHINGVQILLLAMCIFQTGRLFYKSGSKATLVYRVDNRKSLKTKILPFFKTYVTPFSSGFKKHRVEQFEKLLILFEHGVHKSCDGMCNEILPIWDNLRMQKGQKNESFPDLASAQAFSQKTKKSKDF
uniref:Putative LAGLIDADG homing endonuclease n=1 Tax=Jenufa minuta TaxID=993092 RepID=A0A0S2LNS8_JENMI|nr:putative LAGLIDADG homing endonuclease [Jenufa minuta]YP_009184934.1 putative LAGLIDADG homing endonuclease [Jenufa minuta]ALO63012.1 putative LAGLIDADG homing endonuclease [Jenufa minuta]ALO63015.1 putative LAGLIDADG homing endonuclease [Jenufa minuta]